jgi:hypothetical protein
MHPPKKERTVAVLSSLDPRVVKSEAVIRFASVDAAPSRRSFEGTVATAPVLSHDIACFFGEALPT